MCKKELCVLVHYAVQPCTASLTDLKIKSYIFLSFLQLSDKPLEAI